MSGGGFGGGGGGQGQRVRIKGRKPSVIRFFLLAVAHSIPWIVLLSQMAYYSKAYGPQVLLQLNIAYYLPSIPALTLMASFEPWLDARLGATPSMTIRLVASLLVCAATCGAWPFLPARLGGVLGATALLGAVSAVAFSVSYQLVAWFRAADTIALGLGAAGSGPISLLIQLALQVGPRPARWQWIALFEISAAFVLLGLAAGASLLGQYWGVLTGAVPYVDPRAQQQQQQPLLPDGDGDNSDARAAAELRGECIAGGSSSDGERADAAAEERAERRAQALLLAQASAAFTLAGAAGDFAGGGATWAAAGAGGVGAGGAAWLPSLAHGKLTARTAAQLQSGSALRRAASAEGDLLLNAARPRRHHRHRHHRHSGLAYAAPQSQAATYGAVASSPGLDSSSSGGRAATDGGGGGGWAATPARRAGDAPPRGLLAAAGRAASAMPGPLRTGSAAMGSGGAQRSARQRAAAAAELAAEREAAAEVARAAAAVPKVPSLGAWLPGDAEAQHPEQQQQQHDQYQQQHDQQRQQQQQQQNLNFYNSTPRNAPDSSSSSVTIAIPGAAAPGGLGRPRPSPPAVSPPLATLSAPPGPLASARQGSGDAACLLPRPLPSAFASPVAAAIEAAEYGAATQQQQHHHPSPFGAYSGGADGGGAGPPPCCEEAFTPRSACTTAVHAPQSEADDDANVAAVTAEVARDTWQVLLAALTSSTLLNCVFPFFTYLPSSGALGERLPQALFYARILADIVGRLLPRRRGLMVSSPASLLAGAALLALGGAAFFAYLQAPTRLLCDGVALALVAALWVGGGYINTVTYIMAPALVRPKRATKASALAALTYQAAHIAGLMAAVGIAVALYGDISVEL